MNTKSRITSILNTPVLEYSITGFPSFHLSDLDLAEDIDHALPDGLRLGHLAEKVVSLLIKASSNWEILYESIQLFEGERTIGELDFILFDKIAKELVHLEMAYKFYVYDPTISVTPLNNWIGPNRKDSLKEKLDKTRNKQFPLLYHEASESKLHQLDVNGITQKLCLLVSLYLPYKTEIHIPEVYQNAVKGYYLSVDTFLSLEHNGKKYHIPDKREWGIDPSDNDLWESITQVRDRINTIKMENRSLLCWQKHDDTYSSFFIVWW